MKTVQVEVLRRYPRGGLVHEVGARISIPEYAIEGATAGTRPFVRVVEPDEVVLDADFDATEGALDLARAKHFDLAPFKGQGSGKNGRIEKRDVERWTEAQQSAVEPEAEG